MTQETKKKRILLVDDEPRNLKYLKKHLEKNNFEVHELFSGEDAIEHLEKYSFAHVITDMMMKKINGIELASHIHRKFPSTKTHLITGYDDHTFYQYLETGVLTNIISKPYNFDLIDKSLLL